MRRTIIGGALMAAMLSSLVATGTREAQASKPFTTVTKIACEGCHTSKDEKAMSDKDLTACGKESFKVLKGKGYTRGKNDGEQTKNAQKYLKGFKCP